MPGIARAGVIADMSVAVNTTLNNLAGVSALAWIDTGAERRVATTSPNSCESRRHRSTRSAARRAAISRRWRSRGGSTAPAVLIRRADAGHHIGARRRSRIIAGFADRGVATPCPSDLPELLAMADRVAVMRRGGPRALTRDEATSQAVMALALGHAA